MRFHQLVKVLFLSVAFFISTHHASAQSDGEKFAEGRIALDKYNDCPAALKALQGVSETGRQNPIWISYMAKASECVKNFRDALTYYEKYNQLVPGNGEVVNKIGELRYLARKQQDEIDKTMEEENKKIAEKQAKIRQERKFGSLEQTLAWLEANATDYSREYPCFARHLDFQNGAVRRSNRPANKWRDKEVNGIVFFWIESVPLSALDPDNITFRRLSEEENLGYTVELTTKDNKKLVQSDHYTNRKVENQRMTTNIVFCYKSEETAKNVATAFANAIRLSQQ